MFYLVQKYFLGLAILFFVGVSYFTFTKAFGDATSFTYIPLIHLYLIFGAGVNLLSILCLNPLITNGEEALGMKTPFSHFAIHANLISLMICAPITVYLIQYPDTSWKIEKMLFASSHLCLMSVISIMAIILLFYPLKVYARIKTAPLDSRHVSS